MLGPAQAKTVSGIIYLIFRQGALWVGVRVGRGQKMVVNGGVSRSPKVGIVRLKRKGNKIGRGALWRQSADCRRDQVPLKGQGPTERGAPAPKRNEASLELPARSCWNGL